MSEALQTLARVLSTAEPAGGIFSTATATEFGLQPWTIGRLVEDGVLERVAPGHLRAAHLTWDLRARHRQALVLAGPESALAARSALHHWGSGPVRNASRFLSREDSVSVAPLSASSRALTSSRSTSP